MHPEENARRRDPRKYRYLSEPCPDWKAIGVCLLGNTCPFSHGLFEINLHPTKFRTQVNMSPACGTEVNMLNRAFSTSNKVPRCLPRSKDIECKTSDSNARLSFHYALY